MADWKKIYFSMKIFTIIIPGDLHIGTVQQQPLVLPYRKPILQTTTLTHSHFLPYKMFPCILLHGDLLLLPLWRSSAYVLPRCINLAKGRNLLL